MRNFPTDVDTPAGGWGLAAQHTRRRTTHNAQPHYILNYKQELLLAPSISSMSAFLVFVLWAVLLLPLLTQGLRSPSGPRRISSPSRLTMTSSFESPIATVQIPLGEGYQTLDCTFQRIFPKSSFQVVEYATPFSLNIDKPPKGCPAPIVTQDGPGGERVGDLLRATTAWSQGFNAAGATSDIAMFAGNIRWRKSIFDTTGAPWTQVVDALLSNTSERSKTVILVFEREITDNEGAQE